jgi:hypothetical protein
MKTYRSDTPCTSRHGNAPVGLVHPTLASYNRSVARGWESKSVEEQIKDHQAESETPGKNRPSRLEFERNSRRESIRLARSRTSTELLSTHDDRYRALLERSLAHLDSELAKLG